LAKNGQVHLFSWKSIPDQSQNRVFAVARDITNERRINKNYIQIQKALSERVIFAKTDVQGRIIEVNDMFCNISGYSKHELLGKTHRTVNSGLHPKSFFSNLWKTISRGQTWSGSITNRRKDGSLYYVESIIFPTFDIEGEIESYISFRFDITERIETKKESEKILDILNETSSIAKVGGWELDIATGTLSWTDETFKILGVEKKDGQSPILPEGLELFVEEHKPIIDEAVKNGIERGEPYALEIMAQTPSGEKKWVFTNGKANYRDGKIISLSGTIQDIHEKKVTQLKYNQERQKKYSEC
jgi:PAS domain S-box-containing protein